MTKNIFAMDMAAFEGRTVQQGHANYCAANGHAKMFLEGGAVDAFRNSCPRCGVVLGAVVPAGVEHLHTIGDVALANNQNDTVTTGRPVLYIVNGERVEYTQAQIEAEVTRRENEGSTAEISQHNARCSCGMNQPLMPGHVGFTCKGCNTDYDLPELVYGLDVTITGTR